MADVDLAAAAAVAADAQGGGDAHGDTPPTAALHASCAQQTELESAADTVNDMCDAEPARHDGFLDVVVTSADALDHASAGTATGVVASASSLLLLGSQEHTVELVVTKGAGSYCIRRPLSELLAVLQLQSSAAAPSALEQLPVADLPAFPFKQSTNDALIAKWCGEMTHFLAVHSSALRDVPQWIAFIEESSQGKGSRAHMTAIEFILQPFQYEKLYVPRGSRHELVVSVKKDAHFIVWKFDLEEHDIDFSVTFSVDPQWAARQARDRELGRVDDSADTACLREDGLELTVHARTRYLATTTGRPVEGVYKCPGHGRATLVWDNSYSRLRGKNILYQAQVVSSEIMESATTAADALDEALKAKRKERDDALAASLSTALIVSPQTAAATPSLYKAFLPETLMQPSWIVSTSVSVAGKLASRLFGSQPDASSAAESPSAASCGSSAVDDLPSMTQQDSAQAKSLLEELNGLNMQLLERLESLEDKVVKLTVERDQERSKTHMAVVEKENTATQVKMKALEVDGLRSELQRMQREREAWREIQTERDALLEEKHRWAMADDFQDDEADDHDASARSDLDSELRIRLEHELGQAEASVLRLRAELGYSLSNHLTGTSTRLEKIAREMTSAKKQYEEQVKASEHEVVQLKQELLKFRCQKRVLVTEIRNMKTQTEGQVSVAMAEASEARMVNKRLKKQNELLLTQIRTLVDDSRVTERKLVEQQELLQQLQQQQQLRQAAQHEKTSSDEDEDARWSGDAAVADAATAPSPVVDAPRAGSTRHGELRERDGGSDDNGGDGDPQRGSADDSTVPYTLSAADIALLNGQAKPMALAATPAPVQRANDSSGSSQSQPPPAPRSPDAALPFNPYRARLVAFFQAKDPSMLSQVEEMLTSYAGVEPMLFDSLELKYSYLAMSGSE